MVLDANRLKVDYVDIHDDVVFSETWEVINGSLTRVPGQTRFSRIEWAWRWTEKVKPNPEDPITED